MDIATLVLNTGLRIGEALKLEWKSVHWAKTAACEDMFKSERANSETLAVLFRSPSVLIKS